MKKLIVLCTAGGLLAIAGSAQAVYKCEVNGKTTFSDRPCAHDAQEVEIQYRQVDATKAETSSAKHAEDIDKQISELNKRTAIAKQQAKIKSLKQERYDQLKALKEEERQQKLDNITSKSKDMSREIRANAIDAKYSQKIEAAQRELDRLKSGE